MSDDVNNRIQKFALGSENTQSATNVAIKSAQLNGTVDPNGLETTYYFEWGKTPAYGYRTSPMSAGSGINSATVMANLTGLTPNTIYHFRLVSISSGGTINGSDRTFKTQVARNIDFSGDGKGDILWRHAINGQVYMWLMNGFTIFSQGPASIFDPQWEIKGVGDFNGDGKADILWRHAITGQVAIWLMDGTNISSMGSVGMVSDLGWQIEGIGDFNGDGKADILWRHAVSGQLYIWLMNGTTIASMASPATVDSGWEVKGIGDFNGDGKADILWRHAATGQLYIWLMDGTTIASMASPATVDLGWEIIGVGDFNGDGRADILWSHAVSGQLYIWLMNGISSYAQDSPGTVSPSSGWQVKGIGDFNGDGKADILWRHAASGQLYIWLMNGIIPMSEDTPGTVGDLNWEIK